MLIKSTGLENEEGRALNKSKTLAEVGKVFDLPDGIVGRNRLAPLKRSFNEVGDDTS